jgi:hypothetical protein
VFLVNLNYSPPVSEGTYASIISIYGHIVENGKIYGEERLVSVASHKKVMVILGECLKINQSHDSHQEFQGHLGCGSKWTFSKQDSSYLTKLNLKVVTLVQQVNISVGGCKTMYYQVTSGSHQQY